MGSVTEEKRKPVSRPDPRVNYFPLADRLQINVAAEAQKISFNRDKHGTYTVFYDGKEIGKITYHETRFWDDKSEESLKWIIRYKLQTMHLNFRNDELATIIADRLYTDYSRNLGQ